jgi:hypothetical protein
MGLPEGYCCTDSSQTHSLITAWDAAGCHLIVKRMAKLESIWGLSFPPGDWYEPGRES